MTWLRLWGGADPRGEILEVGADVTAGFVPEQLGNQEPWEEGGLGVEEVGIAGTRARSSSVSGQVKVESSAAQS